MCKYAGVISAKQTARQAVVECQLPKSRSDITTHVVISRNEDPRFGVQAGLAQLVERQLPKLEVAGSRPVSRSSPSANRGPKRDLTSRVLRLRPAKTELRRTGSPVSRSMEDGFSAGGGCAFGAESRLPLNTNSEFAICSSIFAIHIEHDKRRENAARLVQSVWTARSTQILNSLFAIRYSLFTQNNTAPWKSDERRENGELRVEDGRLAQLVQSVALTRRRS